MSLVAGIMVPHPPLIVPAVGRGQEHIVQKTIDAYRRVARFIVDHHPQTFVISSPHAPLFRDAFHISQGAYASGSFADFRAPEERFEVSYDEELAQQLMDLAQGQGIPIASGLPDDKVLDHGTMVPLYFIREAYRQQGTLEEDDPGLPVPIVRIGLSLLPLELHYRLGELVTKAAALVGRRIAYIASGDLSHKLTYDGPYGFAPEGPAYDERIMDVMGRAAFKESLRFPADLCDRAAECGHRSFVIMGGAFNGIEVQTEKLSHESQTGVGYGICTYEPLGEHTEGDAGPGAESAEDADSVDGTADDRSSASRAKGAGSAESDESAATCTESGMRGFEDPYVALARASLTSYITEGRHIAVPEGLPDECYTRRAGTFVSLHEFGELRGCIGTLGPTQKNIACEIIENAISAATRDPRFPPVSKGELSDLDISVDILGEMEPIDSFDELDPKRYGVVVSHGFKRGLLLPNLEGVDSVAQQVAIACQKAGIAPGESYSMERFEVVRHH